MLITAMVNKVSGPNLTTKLLSIDECAEALGLSTWTIRRLLKHGKLPRVKIGSRVLVRASDIERFIQQHTDAAVDDSIPPGFAANEVSR
jgi:excisionase family DNA binding protein